MVANGGSVRPNSISCRDAIRELHQRVKAAVPDADPAPWLDVSPDLIEMFSEGDEVAFVRRKKMEERSMLVLQRGLLSGAVRAHFSDGLESRDVPGWAWAGAERNEHVWFEGRLPLDVFMPDEWQRWSCHSVYLDRDAFTDWMESLPLHDPADLPALPVPYDAQSKPEPVKKRPPPDAPFVTLSEALTWIAFGFALNRDSLDRAISGNAFDATDPKAALSDAMARLAIRAGGGQIAARGKYVESHSTDENKVLTAPIDPVRFEDFAQFDILYDGLRYGTGLTWNKGGSALERALQDRGDAFRSVKISRADLLKYFPPEIDNTRALLSPLPAALPEIGAVMGVEEALSWLAHGKPSDDVQLWQNALGWLRFRYSTGEVFNVGDDEEMPEHHRRYREANRKLWTPLQDGTIAAFVHVAGEGAFSVPRYYWNQVQPEHLDHAYRGMTDSDDGRGNPILLSRLAFDKWRGAVEIEQTLTEFTVPPPAPKRRGRTKGTGYQMADALLLEEMRKAIEADPSLNATSAAKLFADKAKGASFEAKADRLARAFRAGRKGE